MSRVVRLFSSVTGLQKKAPKVSSISKEEINRAINLLSNKDFNLASSTITESEKGKLIHQFTSALNTDIKGGDTSNIRSHFNQSILGLNDLLRTSSKSASLSKDITKLDTISIKEIISKCSNEYELLQTFDHFVHNEMMTLSNFRLFLLNKNLVNLDHIVKKFQFMDPSNTLFVKHKLLLAAKALMLKNQKLSLDLYEQNLGTWLKLAETNSLSKLLEKSLYQVHYKITKDVKLLIKLAKTPSSYISLIETLPRQLFLLKEAELTHNLEFTKNQQYLIEMIEIINNQPWNTENNGILKSLLKLSIDNKLSLEKLSQEKELTVQKCRFVNGLGEIGERVGAPAAQLVQRAGRDSADTVYSETVLRFV